MPSSTPGTLASRPASTLVAATLMAVCLQTASIAGEINTTDGIAVSGYDVVSYFNEQGPVKGLPEQRVTYRDATFLFSTAVNKAIFAADPARYAPQYGGFCAYGTARGYKAPIDPAAFTLIDGKLYLNYDQDVQQTWRKDTAGYISRANENWPTVKTQ